MDAEFRTLLNSWMVRLADGDRSVFHPIFEKAWPLVHRFTTRYLQGTQDAEDVAQQALLNVMSRASEFDRSRDALSWILGIAAFECRTYQQKVRRRKEEFEKDDDLAGQPDHREGPEDALLRNNLATALQEAIGKLNPGESEAVLSYLMETDRPLGVAPATFRKRVERGLKKIKVLWSVHESV